MNIKLAEKEIVFPSEMNERQFKRALTKVPMKFSELKCAETVIGREFTLSLRPGDLNQLRENLKAYGLEDCPATNTIFNLLCASPEPLKLRTLG